jgi:glycosyltransferase involved in cell wall biosynthesis
MWWLEVVFENIINRLVKKWYEVGIITIKATQTLPTYENTQWIQIRRVGTYRINFLWKALWIGLKIANQYDLIHTTTYAAAIPASIIGRWRNKPVVLTIHEVFWKLRKRYKPYRRKIYKWFEQMIFWFPYTKRVCVSDYTKHNVHRLYKIPKRKLFVITNGIDNSVWNENNKKTMWIDEFKQRHNLNGHFIGLYYGHSGASKGLDYYIHAIPDILKDHPHFKAILNIIPGNRDHKIYSLIKKLHLEEHIIILHGLAQKDLVNLVYLADFVIVPSISDGFGMVAAEVSQLNRPLIVTRNGALPEVVSGKVVFLRDLSTSSICEAVTKIKNEQRHTIPHKEFLREETVRKYEEMYERCV